MVVNNCNHVKFISYTGKYPALCIGVLTLEIDGVVVKFGHDYSKGSWETDGNYHSFWESGGGCVCDGAYDSVFDGEWEIDKYDLPEQYRRYADEIDRVFNDNVPHGCCGGCV